jgi:hypothetical protein
MFSPCNHLGKEPGPAPGWLLMDQAGKSFHLPAMDGLIFNCTIRRRAGLRSAGLIVNGIVRGEPTLEDVLLSLAKA